MAATVRVSDIEMPGMFATKPDNYGPYWAAGDAYEPLPYELGEICERCWLGPRDQWAGLPFVDWAHFEADYLRAVGRGGCPHGGGAS
jgi:hypothetical protein